MPGLGCWLAGFRYVFMTVMCLLLLCLAPSSPAVVFPNDVLSSLQKYNSASHHHAPKAKTQSFHLSHLSSKSGTSMSEESSKETPSPVTHPSYQSVSKSDTVEVGDIFSRESPQQSHLSVPVLTDITQDYDDYTEFAESPWQARGAVRKTQIQTTAESISKQHRFFPPTPEPQEDLSPSYYDTNSLEEAEEDRWKSNSSNDNDNQSFFHTDNSDSAKEHPAQCQQCQLREGDRAYRIESLKQKILDRLHFTALPNRTGMSVPKSLSHISGIHTDLLQDAPYGEFQQQYNDDNDDDDDEYTPPERIFTFAKPLPAHLRGKEKNSCYFAPSDQVKQLRVKEASLWFYVRYAHVKSTVIQMRVSRMGPPYSRKQRPSKKVIWTHKANLEKAFGWKQVDVTNVVRHWLKHPSSNYGLEILALSYDENLAILPPTSEEFNGFEPTLDIKVTKHAKHRSKRSDFLTCYENSTEHRCCRYPLTVSFAEFGWEWVIAPTYVKADYCSGECRMTLQNKTPYSWIASQTTDGGSCCTPSKMSSLPLLYFDHHGEVVFQMLQNMRVVRCGCA